MLELAADKNGKVTMQLIKDYKMDPRTTVFIGGGASAVVPHLAKTLGHRYRIARNASVISPIGVALAMVRDVVERFVMNPTEKDIVTIRLEAELLAIHSGAVPESVEVTVEIDTARNMLKAVGSVRPSFVPRIW